MLDRHSLDAVKLMERATELARQFGHSYIGPEHLLLAFTAIEGSPESIALFSMGLTQEVLSKQIEVMFGRNEAHSLNLRLNTAAKDILQTTKLRHAPGVLDSVTSEHIFEVLMAERGGVVNNICRSLGLLDEHVDQSTSDANLGEGADVGLSKLDEAEVAPEKEARAHLALNCEIPMAEGDFTEAANFALLFCRVEAATFNFASRRLDATCLLVGLAQERSGNAGKMLRRRGVTVRKIRGEAGDAISQKLIPKDMECLVFDTDVRRIIQAARKASRTEGHDYVSTLHLLDAILSSGPSKCKEILSQLLEDVAALRAFFPLQPLAPNEGSFGEMELNDKIFRALEAGEQPEPHLLEESTQEAQVPGPLESFDLTHLTADGLAVMEAALREYSSMRSPRLDTRHVLLGLLANERNRTARYLHSWGISLPLAKRKISLSSLEAPANPEASKLDDSVTALLNSAFSLAKQTDAGRAGPEHLFWALTKYYEPVFKQLIVELGLDADVLQQDAALLCQLDEPILPKFSPKFAKVSPAGLLIYAIVCEPGVAMAMQEAMKEATAAGAPQVTGAFLLKGLLADAGEGGEILRSLGLNTDTARSIIEKLYPVKVPVAVGKSSKAPPAKVTASPSLKAKGRGGGKDGGKDRGKDDKGKPGDKPVKSDTVPELDFAPELESAFYRGLAMSLQTRQPALATRHLLWGLLESENAAFLMALQLCDISPLAILEKLDSRRRIDTSGNATMVAVDRLVSTIGMRISPQLYRVFELAGDAALHIGTNSVDLLVLIYALSHPQAGAVADKLLRCGLERQKLKTFLGLERKEPLTGQPFIAVITLAVVAEAEHVAEALGCDQLECEHLMMAILSACQHKPRDYVLTVLGIDTTKLSIQLCLTGDPTTRSQEMEFGPELEKRLANMDLAASSVLINAAALAVESGRNFIDTEQLLVALCNCSKKKMTKLLHSYGLTNDRLEKHINRYVSRVMEYSRLPLTLTRRLNSIFEDAFSLAAQANCATAGVDHLVLALLKENEGIASFVLRDLGVDRGKLAARLIMPDTENIKLPEEWHANASALESARPESQPKIGFDLSVFHPRTTPLFDQVQSVAQLHPVPAGGGAVFIEPCHFLFALLQLPELSKLVFVDAVSKKLNLVKEAMPEGPPPLPGRTGVAALKPGKSQPKGKASKGQPAKAKKSFESEKQCGALEFSASTKRLITAAYKQSRLLTPREAKILPEHLLLAVLDQADPWCDRLLEQTPIDYAAVKARILGYIND